MKKALSIFLIAIITIGFFACRGRDKQSQPSETIIEEEKTAEENEPTPEEKENHFKLFKQAEEYFDAGELDLALEKIEAANSLYPDFPPILTLLGNIHLGKGNYVTAISNYTAAIQIKIEDEDEDADVYAKRGEAYLFMGNYDAAITDYSHALRLDEGNSKYWNNRGEVYRTKGDDNRAIDDFLRAINIDNKYTNALNNLGFAYSGTGNYNRAIEYFNRVINIDQNHTEAWNNRGNAWLEKGDFDRAVADFTHLLNFNNEYAIAYSNRSRAYLGKREYQRALDDCNMALRIDRNFTPALNNRAHIYREMGQYQRAMAAYRECLENVQLSVNINDISVYAWYLAGQVYKEYPYLKDDIQQHDFWSEFAGHLALEGIGRGVRNAENIRKNMGVQGAGLMTQMLYLYYAGVDFEATLGFPENAFLYSESLRSRGFLEQVGAEAAIRLEGVTERERNRFKQLRTTIEERQAVINTFSNARLTGDTNYRYLAAVQRRREAEEALATLDRTIGKRLPRYAELRNPKPITLNEAIAYCGEDRAVLEYVLWDASAFRPIKGYESWDMKSEMPAINSYCLVITKDGLTAVQLDSNFDYHTAIQKLREWVSLRLSNTDSYEIPNNNLYNQLIKPVLPYIQNVKNITIVPDADLALIPFDILRENSEENFLTDRYAISLSPSLSVSILAQKNSDMQYSPIMFFGNDEYAGRKYPIKPEYWNNLPGINNEIKLLQNITAGLNIDFVTYLRENATEETLQNLSSSQSLRNYPIVHFACHGYFYPEKPMESGLLLYQNNTDGYLTITEIAVLDLNAQMVILSACETGLGEARLGEGMVGLARAFMAAGAGSVGVSLWNINDAWTGPFMELLYKKVLEEGKPFREAYREVKEIFRGRRETSNPYYWAAFTMYE